MPLELHQLKKLDDYRFLVPRGTKPGMLTDALIFTDEWLLKDLMKDLSLEQAINVAMLPGIVGRSLAMPDIHQGYGFPIGGVAATDPHGDGVVSPGGVGFDINCGVRLLGSSLTRGEVHTKIRELVNQLFRDIPSGAGHGGNIRISYPDLDNLLQQGAAWMAEHGYGRGEDLTHCEESGAIDGADPEMVSDHAKKRGLPQVGTLGSGNHFLEVQYVEQVFDPGRAEAMGIGGIATGLGMEGPKANLAAAPAIPMTETKVNQIGRPVRVVSIGFRPGRPLEEIAALVDAEGAKGADLIAIPETCRGQNATSIEALDGPTVCAMAELARKHRTYLVCPIDRKDGARRFNSAVLLDRQGQVACIYDKLYPVWQVECLMNPTVIPGNSVTVYQTDFGRVGLAICFDVNWTSLWQQLSNQGAEMVIWPSAFSAGRSLQAQATNFHYYIVSATRIPDCLVFDLDGEQLVHDHNNRGDQTNVTRVTLDLDRCVFHQDINCPDKLKKLLQERGEDVAQDKWLSLEGWFVLKALRPGVSARELARQYGLEELQHYINRSQCEIDKCRGWEFS